MRMYFVLATIVCSVGVCLGQAGPSASELMQRLLADDEFELRRLDPEESTLRGDHRFDRTWSDYSADGRSKQLAHVRQVLQQLDRIDVSQLGEQDALNHRLLRRSYDFELEGARFPSHFLPLDHMRGNHLRIPRVIAAMPTRQESDYETILSRLSALPAVVAQWHEVLEEGLQRGVTLPKAAMTVLPGQIIGQVNAAEAITSPLLQPFRNMPEAIPAEARDNLRRRALTVFTSRIRPAYEQLHSFLVTKYIPSARTTDGWSDLPEGRAWYAYEVRRYTTTNRSAEEVHSSAQHRIDALNVEFRRLTKEFGIAGGPQELRQHLDQSPSSTSLDQLLRDYRDIAKRIDPLLPKYFRVLPRVPFGVDVSPEFRGRITAAYYEAPPLDGSRPGMFFVPRSPEDNPSWRMVQLVLHEGMPGHHLERALTMELPRLPPFRMRNVNAFVEGWASYADSVVGREMGMYQKPEDRYGLLVNQMISAVGNANDTGLHALGWSRERAIAFRATNTGLPHGSNESSTDRYSVWPAQILSYSAAGDVISALREEISQKLGSRFEVREFHHAVLRDGPVPMDILQERVRLYFRDK